MIKTKKYNFTDGTFAVELDDDNTMKVLKRLEKEHPDLQTELGFSATKTRYGSKYIYCGNDGFLWTCGKTYCLAKKLKIITAEEYLGQFEEKLTVPKGIIIGKGKTHGGYPLAREDLSNTNFDSNLGLSAEDIVEIDSDGREYTADDLRRIDKAVKYFSKDKEELTYEKLLKCDGMKCSFKGWGNKTRKGVIQVNKEYQIIIVENSNSIYSACFPMSIVKNIKLIEETFEEYTKRHGATVLEKSDHDNEIARFIFNKGLWIVYQKENGEISGNYWLAEIFYRNFIDKNDTNMHIFPSVANNKTRMENNRKKMDDEAEAEDLRISLIEEKEEPMKNETITVEKKVYDIMQKNSLDKIETQHENKMLKQKLAGLFTDEVIEKLADRVLEIIGEKQKKEFTDYVAETDEMLSKIEVKSPKINPETGQYKEMPEDDTYYWFVNWDGAKRDCFLHDNDCDRRCFYTGNMFHTKEACEKMAKKIRELLKGGV